MTYRLNINYKGFSIRRNRHGAAYVLALMTLLMGSIFALAMLRAGSAYFIAEDTRTKKRTAMNLAEAAINYAYWQVQYKGVSLPYSANVNFSSGSFSVQASDDGSRDPSTMLITATGTSGKHSYTTSRDVLGLLPYRYSWCENYDISTDKRVTVTGTGGMRANGRINLSSNSNNVTAGAWATGTITHSGTVTPKYPNGPPVRFPDINFGYYNSIANWTYPWSISINGLSGNGVIYVTGNINIRGVYTGVWTIVATGDINISASLTASNSSSYMALISDETIDIQGGAVIVDAILYARENPTGGAFVPGSGEGFVTIHGATTINGCVLADHVTNDNTITINRPPGLNLTLIKQLRLPGL